MYLVIIAWFYVAFLMAAAEATSAQGSWLGALFTFVLYGLLPLSLVVYLMGSRLRRQARANLRQKSATAEHAGTNLQQLVNSTSLDPDAGREPPTAPTAQGVAPVREEP